MSINPVPGIGPANEVQAAPSPHPALTHSASVEVEPVQPDSGSPPKQEIHRPQNTEASPEMPEDEVQVQRDSGTNGEIVIRYIDRSGDVILQVPSSQVLGVSRAIHQDLEREVKNHASEEMATDAEGGKVHGH